jgi:hypothetical protein
MVVGMRTLLVFDMELDEGKRPSTRFRRLDRLVRLAGSFVGRLNGVRAVHSVSLCDPAQAELLRPEVRYDGRQVAPTLDQLEPGIPG